MFASVRNAGGRAACQDDRATFEIMRASQTASWSGAALESYRQDLEAASRAGRNLVEEKYARMMHSTAPEEYARLAHRLPPVDPESVARIDALCAIVLAWEEDLAARFPRLTARGRPLLRTEDRPCVTSLETYLRAELATFSPRTLGLLLADAREHQARSVNGAELGLEAMVQSYGFRSLAEAEAHQEPPRGGLRG